MYVPFISRVVACTATAALIVGLALARPGFILDILNKQEFFCSRQQVLATQTQSQSQSQSQPLPELVIEWSQPPICGENGNYCVYSTNASSSGIGTDVVDQINNNSLSQGLAVITTPQMKTAYMKLDQFVDLSSERLAYYDQFKGQPAAFEIRHVGQRQWRDQEERQRIRQDDQEVQGRSQGVQDTGRHGRERRHRCGHAFRHGRGRR